MTGVQTCALPIYIPTDEGWLFLAVVLDLFNRQVVGWSLGEDMRCELVIDAFEMARYRRVEAAEQN